LEGSRRQWMEFLFRHRQSIVGISIIDYASSGLAMQQRQRDSSTAQADVFAGAKTEEEIGLLRSVP
jgi:hypothetical protein